MNFAISELSDGQRYLIALYMVLHFLIARGSTVFIDEPDNFVALREIQPWLLAAEEAVEENRGQPILVSHHPRNFEPMGFTGRDCCFSGRSRASSEAGRSS